MTLSIKYDRPEAVSKIAEEWLRELCRLPNREALIEIRQILIDALDAVEQDAEEEAVLSALSALEMWMQVHR